MFGFLKDKIKGALQKFSKKVEEAPEREEEVEVPLKVESSEVKKEKSKGFEKKESKKIEKREAKKQELKKDHAKKEERKQEPKTNVIKTETKFELPQEPVAEGKEEIEHVVETTVEVKEPPKEEKKGFFARVKESFSKPIQEKVQARPVSIEPPVVEKVKVSVETTAEKKKGFFRSIAQKLATKQVTSELFEELFWDLELALLENNVAVEVVDKIKKDLKASLVDKPVPRGKVEEVIAQSLHASVEGLFMPGIDLLAKAKEKTPLVICMVGINGGGKTTSIAKLAQYFQSHKLSVVLAAADTFRAAAIDQLQLHADKLGVKLIKHDYGADPAAVAFDAIKHAQATKKDVVLIDTAGRLHSNTNLVDEMKKIVRVAKPDLKIFVGESITGNDCVEQAKTFDDAVNIDGIILSKADVDEKGGAAISISYVTRKPILFIGTGQEYKDIKKFDSEEIIEALFS